MALPEKEIAKKPNHDRSLRILVVDDSKLQLRIITKSLVKFGFSVHAFERAEDALIDSQEWQPDIVISDWMMPEMDGLEFCRQFKSMSRPGYGYFILLTSKSGKDEIAQGLETGADDFLTKPVNGHELRARLTAGKRIVKMHRELAEKNSVISETLSRLQYAHDALNSDLLEAKKLQQSLIREKHVTIGTSHVSFLLQSSGHVGGDLVGYYPVSDNQLGIFSIDVSGHGVSSALMTARLAGLLTPQSPSHNVALWEDENGTVRARAPVNVISDLNKIILGEMDTDHYFTILLALANLETGRITICQAGHPHPIVQRQSGEIEHIGHGGFPVGLFDDAEFEQFEIMMKPGDRLLLASDGIIECPNTSGSQLGEQGFSVILHDLRGHRGPQVLDSLAQKLMQFAGSEGFPDDVSAAIFEYKTRSN